MERNDKRVFGVVSLVIITTMVTALAVIRFRAIEAQRQSQPNVDGPSAELADPTKIATE